MTHESGMSMLLVKTRNGNRCKMKKTIGKMAVVLGVSVMGVNTSIFANEMTRAEIIAAAEKMALAQFEAMNWNFWGRFWMDGVCFAGVADLANVTNHRWGGMLSAALFLREFVPESVQWAHVDIAGPAFNTGGPWGYTPKGGTGVPVRTLIRVLEDIAANG